ncbi:hypothetical protein EV143_11819 [Flavobacterium chryseum]|uniref:hypothetical protein n=1 Tax=Flavobacterium sp. P3160 TaxID=2512113 RepID=UPI00105F06B0|nr:hypothetical protein [Flavobacterium sp. P3160]TDO68835.1 hypothetical protein EV143_11819 [Flavobacterium sp. P3160]
MSSKAFDTSGNEAIYSKYLEALRVKLIAKYDELGLRASGDYADALEPEVTPTKMIMWGAFHSEFMERGRSSGKFPPINVIEEWIETKKNLPPIFREKKKQMAFLIARKIANEGIQVPNEHNKGKVVSAVVDDFLANDINEMLDELGEVYQKRIEIDVLEIFKEVA